MLSSGDVRNRSDFFEEMISLLSKLSDSKEERISLHRNACKLVDGNGAVRIAEKLKKWYE